MIIFKDLISGDEMFTDASRYKIVDEVLFEVAGQHVTRKHGDVQLAGSNPSAEGEDADAGGDESSESGVDVVLNNRLKEMAMDKKSYTAHIKEYMKALSEKIKERNGDVDTFKKNAQEAVKKILGNITEYQFFCGESYNPEGMTALLIYRDDTPYLYFWKDGMKQEKV